jgi:DNA repair protein RecN (Recombination protein N)
MMRTIQNDLVDGAALEEHINLWLEIKRAYGPTIEQVISKKEALAHKLATQGDIEGSLLKLEHKAKILEKEACTLAAELTKVRRNSAEALQKETMTVLLELGFKKAILILGFKKAQALSELGDHDIQFLFSPNAGQTPLPLAKMASSGEMARVMLALKSVFARMDHTPVLVFDEVDANVGGEIGAQVGRHLALLGKNHQVLCVTHLPQVACQGQTHWTVVKHQGVNQTRVEISEVHTDTKTRVSELARMLGDRNCPVAQEHARVLLGKK